MQKISVLSYLPEFLCSDSCKAYGSLVTRIAPADEGIWNYWDVLFDGVKGERSLRTKIIINIFYRMRWLES